MKRKITLIVVMLLIASMFPITALAGSSSSGGITLNFPNNMDACKPTFNFSTTGVDPSWKVRYDIFKVVSTKLVKIGGGSTTGNLNVNFAPDSLSPGETQKYAIFVAVSVPGQEKPTKLRGKWQVDCNKELPPTKTPTPTKPPTETPAPHACTPGFWKQPHHFQYWVGIEPDDDYNAEMTYLEALQGGRNTRVSRVEVAAMLNAANPNAPCD